MIVCDYVNILFLCLILASIDDFLPYFCGVLQIDKYFLKNIYHSFYTYQLEFDTKEELFLLAHFFFILFLFGYLYHYGLMDILF